MEGRKTRKGPGNEIVRCPSFGEQVHLFPEELCSSVYFGNHSDYETVRFILRDPTTADGDGRAEVGGGGEGRAEVGGEGRAEVGGGRGRGELRWGHKWMGGKEISLFPFLFSSRLLSSAQFPLRSTV